MGVFDLAGDGDEGAATGVEALGGGQGDGEERGGSADDFEAGVGSVTRAAGEGIKDVGGGTGVGGGLGADLDGATLPADEVVGSGV